MKKTIFCSIAFFSISINLHAEHLTPRNASLLSVGTLPSARLDASSVTLQGNQFNGADQLLKFNVSSDISASLGVLGNVTINTTAPDQAVLDISTAGNGHAGLGAAVLSINHLDGGGTPMIFTAPISGGEADLDLSEYNAAQTPTTRIIYFKNNGPVGIGTVNPSSRLDIFAASQTIRGTGAGLAITAPAGSVSNLLVVSTGTKQLLVVHSTNIRVGVDLSFAGSPYNNPDYVFAPQYNLMPINDLQRHVNERRHLPGMKSTEQVEREGVQAFGQIHALQEKLEEAYLYIFELNKRLKKLED